MNFKIQHLPAILLRDLENPKISWKIVESFPHPKTEQEMVKETIENLPQSGQAVLETNSVIGSGANGAAQGKLDSTPHTGI